MKGSLPSVNVARLLFLVFCELAGLAIAMSSKDIPTWAGLFGGLMVAAFIIFVERLSKGFTLRGFSNATFGLAVGLFCAFLLNRVGIGKLVSVATESMGEDQADLAETLGLAFNLAVYASLSFIGAVLALRGSQDDFAFIIPYVRFRQDSASGQPLILDAEVIMDGRISRLMISDFFTGRLIVPEFVLHELQVMANSPSTTKRQRGQRGLEILEEMQANPGIPVSIHDATGIAEDESMQGRLVQTAKILSARLITTDENLTKVGHLQGVSIINLNDLSEALKPKVVVGESVRLALVRAGKDDHQAVGYMPDGTMIVVNHAISKMNSTQDVTVISKLQTSGGEMVFAELDENVGESK